MASALPLRQNIIVSTLPAEGVTVSQIGEEIVVDVVVYAGRSKCRAALDAYVAYASAQDIVDSGKLQLIVGIDGAARAVAAGIEGVVVGRVSSSGAARHASGNRGKPYGIDGSCGRGHGGVVIDGDVLD